MTPTIPLKSDTEKEDNKTTVAGVDIGGSHISASLFDLQEREIIPGTFHRSHIDSSGSPGQIISEWSNVIRKCYEGHPISSWLIGIAMPGPVNYETGECFIKGQNKYEHLYGQNIKTLLAGELGICQSQIRLVNDAAAFLMGEMFAGSGRESESALAFTLGTGLGSAYADQQSVKDADLWQHPFLDGIAEDYLSATWLLNEANKIPGRNFSDVKSLAKAATEDETIRIVFSRFGYNLGLFASTFVREKRPDTLILGGNISRSKDLFQHAIEKSFNDLEINSISIQQATLGEDAAIVGAASCWH